MKEFLQHLIDARKYIDHIPGEYYDGQRVVYDALIETITDETPLHPVVSAEEFKNIIRNRISYFQSKYHSHEAGRLTLALKAINELIPPNDFAAIQSAPVVEKEPKTHETFVVGFNNLDEVVFCKSYEYLKEKDKCQSDLKWVMDNCAYWELGAMSEFKLSHEDKIHNIVIPHP